MNKQLWPNFVRVFSRKQDCLLVVVNESELEENKSNFIGSVGVSSVIVCNSLN